MVIVTWNNAEIIGNALRSLLSDLAQCELRYEVWLVDSASDDHTVDVIRRDFNSVILLENETNIGFGAANNQAIRQLGFDRTSRRERPRAVYLLNPDTITHLGATKRLFDALHSLPDAGVVGARLTFADGSFQHSAFRFPGLRQIWAELFPTPGRLIEGRFNGRYPRASYADAAPFDVDFTLGATMMLKREAIEEAGMFDEDFFIYCEEVDWAWRIKKFNWRILCVPQAHVTHLGGQSTSQVRPSSLIHLWKSRLLLYEKHFPSWKRRLARRVSNRGHAAKNAHPEDCGCRVAGGLPGGHRDGESMTHLTAIVLTYNESEHIADCIKTLRFTDRIIVFDSYSTDDTVAIAQRSGADIFQHEFVDYSEQRNAALDAADEMTDWVLFVDADERVTDSLAAEIRQKINLPDYAGWRIPRHNYIFGVLTKGAGWYPDYQTRLLRVGQAYYDTQRKVHEVVKLYGPEGTIQHPILHYNYRDLAHFKDKQEYYARFDAESLYANGVKPNPRNFILQPLRQFYWRFFALGGYRDRWHGLRLSLLMAWYEYRKYQVLESMWRKSR